MAQCIVYLTVSGDVAVIYPAHGIAAEDIAATAVPPGRPFAIRDTSDLPEDRSTRSQWLLDEANMNGPFGLGDPPPAAVPPTISDRQFAQGLAGHGLITEAEALAWVSAGTLPAAITSFVALLPAGDQFGARMILQGATVFERAHPFTTAFGAAVGMGETALDAFWRECASL